MCSLSEILAGMSSAGSSEPPTSAAHSVNDCKIRAEAQQACRVGHGGSAEPVPLEPQARHQGQAETEMRKEAARPEAQDEPDSFKESQTAKLAAAKQCQYNFSCQMRGEIK